MKTHSRLGVTIPDIVAVTVNDGNTIDFTASGTNNQTITAEVVIDPAVDNITVATVDGVYTKLIDEVTYAELAALISGSDLIQGRQYLITDYRTTHTVPGTVDLNTGSLEPIIVTAVDSNSLASLALSTIYPNDILYYNVSNVDQSKVQNQTMGFINRRIDTENNIDVPFDFRNVKFRRWEIDVPDVWDIATSYPVTAVVVGSDGSVYLSMIAANLANDPITDTYHWLKFPFDNGEYVSHLSTGIALSGYTIPVSAFYLDRLIGVSNNTTIKYGGSFANSEKIEYFNVVFTNTCTQNDINVYRASGTIYYMFSCKIFNRIFTNIYGNTITSSAINGEYFIDNCFLSIDDSHISGRMIGCNINSIDNCFFDPSSEISYFTLNFDPTSSFKYNTFNGYTTSLKMLYDSQDCVKNTFNNLASATGISFIAATQVFNDYPKALFERSDGTTRLSYVDNTDTVIYTAINA